MYCSLVFLEEAFDQHTHGLWLSFFFSFVATISQKCIDHRTQNVVNKMNYVYQLKSMFESESGDDYKNYLFQTVDHRIDENLLPKSDPMLWFSNVDLVSICWMFSMSVIRCLERSFVSRLRYWLGTSFSIWHCSCIVRWFLYSWFHSLPRKQFQQHVLRLRLLMLRALNNKFMWCYTPWLILIICASVDWWCSSADVRHL